ncbi:MAG: hypothetical protein Q8Q23_05755 [bacterium]|nr:hypothetical protein [bacterium]
MKKAVLIVFVLMAIFSVTSHASVWFVPDDFATIQDAVDSSDVVDGDKIVVHEGEHFGAYVSKAVIITGAGGAVINDGPLHSSGLTMGFRLLAGSDGATISHFKFTVDLAIMNGDAVNDVTVDQCIFLSSIQAVSNWRGSGWQISHNDIIDLRSRCGGGIGILVADYTGGVVSDNVVSHNKISGILYVDPADCGGYSGTGIVLYADFRWGSLGASELSFNRVIKNTVSLASDTPNVVDVIALEITDTSEGANGNVIFDNAIGFNDFRGTINQLVLTPDTLDQYNDISRNFGENRGHGLHPSVFNPVN